MEQQQAAHTASVTLGLALSEVRSKTDALREALVCAQDAVTGLWNSELPGVADTVRSIAKDLGKATREVAAHAGEAGRLIEQVRSAVGCAPHSIRLAYATRAWEPAPTAGATYPAAETSGAQSAAQAGA